MMRLLEVELTRLRWRRAIVVLLLACVAVPVILLVGYAWSTRPLGDAEIAEAKQMAAMEASQPWVAEQIADCEADPENFMGPGAAAADCAASMTPTYTNYLHRQEMNLESMRTDVGTAALTILTGLMMLVGTTFAGHDWNTGSMSNQLLFEPRRLRVWAAKGLAVLVTGAALGAVVLALFWGGASLVASSRDLPAPPGVWNDILETQARGVAAIAVGGLLGYALTMLFRSTVATLSLMFGVAIAGSLVIVAVLGEGATRWLLPTNFLAFVLGGFTYFDGSACMSSPDGMVSGNCERHLSTMDGGVFLAVIVVVGVLLSMWSMQRRDVP
jgi:ABC-2 type transport system permease protein